MTALTRCAVIALYVAGLVLVWSGLGLAMQAMVGAFAPSWLLFVVAAVVPLLVGWAMRGTRVLTPLGAGVGVLLVMFAQMAWTTRALRGVSLPTPEPATWLQMAPYVFHPQALLQVALVAAWCGVALYLARRVAAPARTA